MATILVASGDNLAAKVEAAKPGDLVQLADATWMLTSSFVLPSGVTLEGQPGAEIVFNLSGQDLAGIHIAANASSTSIKNLAIKSSNGLIRMCDGNGYSGILITDCDFQYGGGKYTDGTLVFGIFATVSGTGLTITNNYFHDSPNSERNWELYNQTNLTIQDNAFFNIVDGGHVVYPGNNFIFDHNVGSRMQRMGQEIQDLGSTTPVTGHRITNNTFYDWNVPYENSFGISYVVLHAISPVLQGNFVEFNIASGSTWGAKDPGGTNRFGYGYEIGGVGVQVLSNAFVGQAAYAMAFCSCSTTGAYAKGNTAYDEGKFALWGTYGTETGGKYMNQATLLTDNQVITTGTEPAPSPAPTAAPVVTPVVPPTPPVSAPTDPAPVAAPSAPEVTIRQVGLALTQSDKTIRGYTLSVQSLDLTPPKHAISGTLVLTCSDGSVQTFQMVL